MAIIGNIIVGVRGNSKGLKKSIDQARGYLNGFTKGANKVAAALAGIGGAIATAQVVMAFKNMAMAQVENIKHSTKMAARIGTTTKALTGLQYAAKKALGTDDIEAFGDALSDMQEKIGDVTLEEGGAKDVLEMLGLDAQAMASQDAERNFLQIADAISNMQNQAEKLHVADTLFGGEGQKMLPLLDKGAEGIKEMQKEAEKMGLTFTEAEAGPILKAQEAIGMLQSQFQGLANQMVIQVAPILTALIDEFTKLGLSGVDSTQAITTGLEWVSGGLGIVGDVVDVIYDGFLFLRSGVTKVLAWIGDGIVMLIEGINWFNKNVLGMETEWGDTARAIAEDLHKLSSDQWGDAMKSFTDKTPSEHIDKFFDGVIEGSEKARNALSELPNTMGKVQASTMTLAKSIKELEESLREQINTFGMSGTEAEIYKLKLAGATDEQLANVRKLANEMKGLERFKEFEEQAKEVRESLKTPQQKYEDEIDKLLNLLNNDLISFEEFQKASATARTDIFGESQGPRFASLSEYGSEQARTDILRHQFGGSSPEQMQQKTLEEQLAQLKQIPGLLQTIAKHVGVDEVFSFSG